MKKNAIFTMILAVIFSLVFVTCDDPVKSTSNKSGTSEAPVFTSISAVSDYLSRHTGGRTAKNPIFLTININLGDTQSESSGWGQLLATIGSTGKYVNLDLSPCKMNSTSFYSPNASTLSAGKERIVSIVLPNVARSIGDNAFGGVLSDESAHHYHISSRYIVLESVSSQSVTSIGDNAFSTCSALQSVNFPAAISIGDYAFTNSYLRSANFPAAISIGNYAFGGCGVLQSINFPEVISIGDWAFASCVNLGSLGNLLSAKFPAAISIGDYAFLNCVKLLSVNFPATISIGDYAFAISPYMYEDNRLYSITSSRIPLHVTNFPAATSIGGYAFQYRRLERINFSAVTYIGDNAFNESRFEEEMNFPAVTYIGTGAFTRSGGTSNRVITMGSNAPLLGPVVSGSFTTIRVPQGAIGYGSIPARYSGSDVTVNWGNGFRGKGWNGTDFVDENAAYGTVSFDIKYIE
ncbi:MAG: leucine-rich repeat domain-containing protein [Treponema sp.]|nr:leucine-rich repeat domain-containing protein [Treponema sp.]